MQRTLERIFTPWTLVGILFLLVWATELAGGGTLFYDTGAIHAFAVLFIILAGTRIFQRYHLYDVELKNFVNDTLAALGVFAVSHFIEFLSFEIFGNYTDSAFANVIDFYCISLLFIIMGCEYVIRNYAKTSTRRIWAAVIASGLLLGFTISLLVKATDISLEVENPWPWLYGVLVVGLGGYAIARLRRIKKMYGWFKGFIDRLSLVTVFVVLAALPNVFYDLLESWGLPKVQIIYLSHFTFYAAMAMMYLAYGEHMKIGGIHADVREAMEGGEMKS